MTCVQLADALMLGNGYFSPESDVRIPFSTESHVRVPPQSAEAALRPLLRSAAYAIEGLRARAECERLRQRAATQVA